jgi:hypothetical protein
VQEQIKIIRFKLLPRLALAVCGALALVACGEGPAVEGQTAEPSQAETPSSRFKPNINNFEFSFTGDPVRQYAFEKSDLILTGGCRKEAGIGIGFTDTSKATGPDLFHFSFGDDGSSPGAGDTGSFNLGKVEWMNGQKFDPEIRAHVANMFIGDGVLTIEAHSGRGMGGRMVGRIEGDVQNEKSRQTASVTATFDINLACVE